MWLKLIVTAILGALVVWFLRMPTREITSRIEPLCWMDIDPEFRGLPVWNIARWSIIAGVLGILAFVWFAGK